jgi:polar amino acid transport system permease protein
MPAELSWDWSYAASCLPGLLRGLGVTLQATLLGYALALLLGLVWALLRRAAPRPVAAAATAAVEFIRSTPLLVQLYAVYFLLPGMGLTVSALAAGVLGIGLHYSAYISEVYRAGLDAVPREQWEAARALSLSRVRTYRSIVLPQAIPPMIPVLGNYAVSLLKDTPLLSAITVVDMLQRAKIQGSESFRYVEPVTLVGAAFLLVSLGATTLIRRAEDRWSRVEGAAP